MAAGHISHSHIFGEVSAGKVVLLFVMSALGLYFLFLAYLLIRVLYYRGNLGPVAPQRIILPRSLRSRIPHPTVAPSSGIDTSNIYRNNGNGPETTSVPEITVTSLPKHDLSHLPTFEQDDCGDGRNFPSVRPISLSASAFSPSAVVVSPDLPDPPLYPPFRTNPPSYMTMGLRKLDHHNWLVVDKDYLPFHTARNKILAEKKHECIQIASGNREADTACEELLQEVVQFLTEKYPKLFTITDGGFHIKGRSIKNCITGEEFEIEKPRDLEPLEICARLAMEDFNILGQGGFTGEHYLVASAILFPAGWHLPTRIGSSITALHNPVPLWKDIPDIVTQSYFTRLNPTSCMGRSSFFIQINPDNSLPLDQLLFIQEGKDFFPGSLANLSPRDIVVRRERQTFRRLPKTGVVVFTVKTSVQKLVDVPKNEREGLVKEIRAWPREIATYKGRDLWQRAVIGFCEGRPTAKVDDGDLVSEDMGTLTRVDEEEGRFWEVGGER